MTRKKPKPRARGLHIDMTAPCPDWRPHDRAALRKAIRATLNHPAIMRRTGTRPVRISVLLGDDKILRRLNRDFRGKDKPTNVLSFPAHEDIAMARALKLPELELGDIALSYQTVAREAREQAKSRRAHVMHMAVHGTLHLLGFDHEREADAILMEDTEIRILRVLGLKNPYEIP